MRVTSPITNLYTAHFIERNGRFLKESHFYKQLYLDHYEEDFIHRSAVMPARYKQPG